MSPSDSVKQAWPRKRTSIVSQSSSVVCLVLAAELARELESDRDADEHPEPRLLGEQRPHRADPLLRVFPAGRLADRLVVTGIEPAALRERRGEHASAATERPA